MSPHCSRQSTKARRTGSEAPPAARSTGPTTITSMDVFGRVAGEDYAQVVFNYDRAPSPRAIIAIRSTALGPALGGTRYWQFDSEQPALTDALRLAKGMTSKN